MAIFSNPRVAEGLYALTEQGMHKGITVALEHQASYPQDNHNALEIQVKKRALDAVQEKKSALRIPLDCPRITGRSGLTIVDCGVPRIT